MDGRPVIIDDFSTNKANNDKYKAACEGSSGKFVQLKYEAECTSTANPMVTTIIVSAQPRCYAKNCGSSDDQMLFEEFTIRPTEERADLDTSQFWECKGELRADFDCEAETHLIQARLKMSNAAAAVKTEVSNKKLWGWVPFTKTGKEVSFTGKDEQTARTECDDAGGNFEKADGEFMCGGTVHEVNNFFTCMGRKCKDESKDTFEENELLANLVKSNELVKGHTCAKSGAWNAASIGAAFGAIMTSLLWNSM